VLITISVYLFATAPLPLIEDKEKGKLIPITEVLAILNHENQIVRAIYTKEIVINGKKSGLKFDENWRDDDLDAGPLPAQFLRLTAVSLEKSKMRLGLFLGSDYPINKANEFTGVQLSMFDKLKLTRTPMHFYVEDVGLYANMYADVAISKACVKCHNKHDESPKDDWKLNDVMGAATWTYPKRGVAFTEFFDLSQSLRKGFKDAYDTYLEKISRMENPPEIGDNWPKDGYYLPSSEKFMDEIERRCAENTLAALSKISVKRLFYEPGQAPD